MSVMAVMLGSLFIVLFLTVPIGIGFGIADLAVFSQFYSGTAMTSMLAQTMVTTIDSFPLLAIPFFMLVGTLMEKGGIAKRLIDIANLLTGRQAGGLGSATIVACCFFAAISGSGPATAAAIGALTITSLLDQGYGRGYAGALIGSASIIGPVIPPSIPMIMYGVTVSVSVSHLFMGGIIPGIMLGLGLIIWNLFISKKRGYKAPEKNYTTQEKKDILVGGIPAILMPLIVLGGIYSGVFTPTECAVVGVVYALVVSIFIYKSLSWELIKEAVIEAGVTSATIMILFGGANTLGKLLTMHKIPELATQSLVALSDNGFLVMMLINFALFIIGMFIDTNSSIILFAPIFAPVAAAYGYDPLHFGIIMVVNLCIGMITPPMGSNLFIGQRIAGTTFEDTLKETLPMIIVLYTVLLVVILFPDLSLLLPRLAGYKG